MKNERSKPNNPTETQTIQSRTQIAAQHSELAINDLHRNTADYIPVNCGSLHFPAAADTPGVRRWSPEEGGEGLRRVHLLRPLVRRKATMKSTEAMRYSPLVKPERKIQRITPIPYKITKDISRTQFDKQTASQSTCPQVHRSRAARYWMPRHPRTCRAQYADCKSKHRTSSVSLSPGNDAHMIKSS